MSDPFESPELRRLVFRALANAAENGYELDESNSAEAIDLMDTDADVEAFIEAHYNDDTSSGVEAVAELVRRWREGARE